VKIPRLFLPILYACAGCGGPAPEVSGLDMPVLPAIHQLPGDCEGLDFSSNIPVNSWVGSADDMVEGTILDVRAAWRPLMSRTGVVDDPTQCSRVLNAIDIVLTDVVSRKSGASLNDLTVRLGSGTLQLWERSLSATFDDPAVIWDHPPPPLQTGMRIGGAVYQHAHLDIPVFMTGKFQPLYEVAAGSVHFQKKYNWECDAPYPDVSTLDGKSPEELAAAFEDVPLNAGESAEAQAYRDWLGIDSLLINSTSGFIFGAYCYGVNEAD
jgi:hypothetical protein